MSYPAYSEYKDSGVDWLREVPVHWAISALSRVLKCPVTDGPHSTPEFVDEGVPFLSVDGIQDGELFFDSCRYISTEDHKEFSKKASPRIDDILMGKAASVGKIARVKTDVEFSIWSPLALIRIDQLKALPEFCEYALKAEESQYQISQKSNSNTQLNIGMKDIPKLRVCFPPLDEQNLIAIFLDHETARIDALVEEQQRLIALLKEKRQAVISHAVTKGLDPDVPMKDSGVEWLGEVPVHWEVVRVKHAAKLESGHTPNKEKAEYWDGSIPWVSLNDSKKLAQYDYIDETNFTISDLGIANSSARLLPSRSVVFTRDATIGLAAITTKEMAVSQHLIAWLCHDEVVIPEYLLLVFYAMKEELDRYTFGATIKTIGMPDIRSLSMPLPSISEQKEVIGYVFAERDRLDDLVAEAQKASRLLVERRSALISAAVTGKIDVRGWQPPEKLQATNDTQKGHEAAAV
mgnify:CR=1 FL=1